MNWYDKEWTMPDGNCLGTTPCRVLVRNLCGMERRLIDCAFASMACCPDWTFLILDDAVQLRDYLRRHDVGLRWWRQMPVARRPAIVEIPHYWTNHGLPNVWLLARVTSQAEADTQLPALLDCPAAKRGVVAAGNVDLNEVPFECQCGCRNWDENACGSRFCAHCGSGKPRLGLDWVVHESGDAALLHVQARNAGVPFWCESQGCFEVPT